MSNSPQIVFELHHHILADERLEERVEKLQERKTSTKSHQKIIAPFRCFFGHEPSRFFPNKSFCKSERHRKCTRAQKPSRICRTKYAPHKMNLSKAPIHCLSSFSITIFERQRVLFVHVRASLAKDRGQQFCRKGK